MLNFSPREEHVCQPAYNPNMVTEPFGPKRNPFITFPDCETLNAVCKLN